MLVIISYDIQDDKKRTRLANKLKDFGPRVQYSVFEAEITAEELKRMRKLLKEIPLEEKESIRLYQLCSTCKSRIKIWGSGEVTDDKPYYIA